MTRHGLLDIVRERAEHGSFHIASEKSVRLEFMRVAKGDTLGPLIVEGDLVVTFVEGAFDIGDGTPVSPMTQVVVPAGEPVRLECTSDGGAVQIIWAPPFPTWRRS